MVQSTLLDPPPGMRLLHAELRRLRRQADVWSTGATIHHLRNYVAAAERSLQMSEECIEHGDLADVDQFLDLAQESLQAVHALIALTRCTASGEDRLIH